MIGFHNIKNSRIEINDFQLKYRFTEPNYNVFPNEHLEQLIPLNKEGSKFLGDFISDSGLHDQEPFQSDFFKIRESFQITWNREQEAKKWLYRRGLPFSKEVYLSWDDETALITTWKLVVKYFDDFFYSGPDDLTVIDESLNWAIIFHHSDDIYFGTNEKYVLSASEQMEIDETSM